MTTVGDAGMEGGQAPPALQEGETLTVDRSGDRTADTDRGEPFTVCLRKSSLQLQQPESTVAAAAEKRLLAVTVMADGAHWI